jgi:hypothetical protein
MSDPETIKPETGRHWLSQIKDRDLLSESIAQNTSTIGATSHTNLLVETKHACLALL